MKEPWKRHKQTLHRTAMFCGGLFYIAGAFKVKFDKGVSDMKKIKISMSGVRIAVYGFLWIDILVFIIGFIKPLFSVPACAALAVMMFFVVRDERKKDDYITIYAQNTRMMIF